MDNTTIITLIIFLTLGISCLMNRESIARYLGKNSMLPFRLIWGERSWITREEQRSEKFAKIMLPVFAILCFAAVIFMIAAVIR